MTRQKSAYFAIVDHENKVVGEWQGTFHYVSIYDTHEKAKLDAIKLRIPDYKIGRAESCMRLVQSQYSTY